MILTYVTPTRRYVPELLAVIVSLVRALLPRDVAELHYAVRMGAIGGNTLVNSHFLHLDERVDDEPADEFDARTYTIAAFTEGAKKEGESDEHRERHAIWPPVARLQA